jgi:hypothetical protein
MGVMPIEDRNELASYLTLREAINLFAPKEAVQSVSTLIGALTDKFEGVVPRKEHELHWMGDDQFKVDVKKRFTDLDKSLADIKEKQVPPWVVLGIFQLIGMALSAGITYGLHAVLGGK